MGMLVTVEALLRHWCLDRMYCATPDGPKRGLRAKSHSPKKKRTANYMAEYSENYEVTPVFDPNPNGAWPLFPFLLICFQHVLQYFGEACVPARGLLIFYTTQQKSFSTLRHPVLFVSIVPYQKIDFIHPVGIDHVLHQEAGQYRTH